jgi:hypothetical protein
MNKFFEKLPFRTLAEKIPAEIVAKIPLLGKAIPFANQIVCGIIALLLVAAVANGGKGSAYGQESGGNSAPKVSGGRAAPATDFTYKLASDGKGVIIGKYTGNGGNVVIPGEIEGYPVVELLEWAFGGEEMDVWAYATTGVITDKKGAGFNITSVVIPANVKIIGNSCFYKIEKLTSVTFLGSGVEIGDYAFGGNINLSEFKFPNGDNVLFPTENRRSKMAFASCKKLPLAVRAKLVSWGFDEP